jgi:hypothetical protein
MLAWMTEASFLFFPEKGIFPAGIPYAREPHWGPAIILLPPKLEEVKTGLFRNSELTPMLCIFLK